MIKLRFINNNNLNISATCVLYYVPVAIGCESELPLNTARFRGIAHRETI